MDKNLTGVVQPSRQIILDSGLNLFALDLLAESAKSERVAMCVPGQVEWIEFEWKGVTVLVQIPNQESRPVVVGVDSDDR